MEFSPSKRRKTSPTTSVALDALTTPSRIPVRKDGTKVLPHRPSFASPTKASIARHNPQLLKRASFSGGGTSESRGKNLEDVFARALGHAHPSIERQDGASGEGGGRFLGSTTVENETAEEDKRTPSATQPNARKSLSLGGGLSAKPRRMSRSPAKQTSRGIGYIGADTYAGADFERVVNPFKRAGLRRSPMVSQEVEEPETDSNPFQRRGLQRSPLATQESQAIERALAPETKQPEISTTPTAPLDSKVLSSGGLFVQDEALEPISAHSHPPVASELPPTPVQMGIPDPIATNPPTGIHDTSSSRASRNKDLGKKLKSSPLKPHTQRAPESAREVIREPRLEPQPEISQLENPKRRKSARFSIPEDPHMAKKTARDVLLKELQQLKADVALANQENKRLQLHYESKKSMPNAPSNADELLSLLVRSTAPEPPPPRNPATNSAFKSIGSFLPFSARRKRFSKAIPAWDKPVPSHLPMAVDNPLPYLQAFSPLVYTSNITLLPSDSSSNSGSQAAQSIFQLHRINASHPSGLFTARLSMTIDTPLLSVSSVDIERLPPSAEKELGTFLREQSSPEGTLTKDIGLVCWAMGRWVEASVLRARFWCAIEYELGTAEARVKNLQKKKKRRHKQLVRDDEDDTVLPDGHEDEESQKQKWTRRQLLPHMGRTAMELSTDKVELRIEWRIKFDWTGEVDSSITASTRLPKSWQEADDRKSLLKVPESFAKLLKQKGPLGAVRTVVGLLMPET